MSHNDECAPTNMLTSQQTQLARASALLIFLFCLTNAALCNITAPLLHYKRAFLMVVLLPVYLGVQMMS